LGCVLAGGFEEFVEFGEFGVDDRGVGELIGDGFLGL
jgi:hypothetical protein